MFFLEGGELGGGERIDKKNKKNKEGELLFKYFLLELTFILDLPVVDLMWLSKMQLLELGFAFGQAMPEVSAETEKPQASGKCIWIKYMIWKSEI